jgi:hypothetical protein
MRSIDQAVLTSGCNQGQWVGQQRLITVECKELAAAETAAASGGEYQCVKRQALSLRFGLASLIRLV